MLMEMSGGVPVPGREGKKMKTEMMLVALLLSLLMAKKNPRRFGQLTLDLGGQALDYLKSDPKGVARQARRIEWANKHHMADLGWSLPPWVLPQTDEDRSRFPGSDRVHDIAIIHDVDPSILPLLVHQATALRGLDACLASAQEDGALVEDDGKRMLLDMGEGSLSLRFIRNTKAGKFASFIVNVDRD